MLNKLKKYFQTKSPEDIQKAWDKTKEFDDISPTIHEFFETRKENIIWDWMFDNLEVPSIEKGDRIEQMEYNAGYYKGYYDALPEEKKQEIIEIYKIKYYEKTINGGES